MLSQSTWRPVGEEQARFHILAPKSIFVLTLNKFIKVNFGIQTRTINTKYLTVLPLPVPLCKVLCTLSHCSPQTQPFQQRELHWLCHQHTLNL